MAENSSPEQTLRGLTRRADLLRSKGRYSEAESCYRQALDLAEKIHGPEHLEVEIVLNNLGVVYKYLARFADARRVYQRSLAIMERVLGPDHPDLATLYHNLGGVEHAAGNHAAGEPFARKSVEIRSKAPGPNHADVAADMAALAALLEGQRKWDEAEQLYRRSLE